MAIARDIKVYKDAENLLRIVTKCTEHFPRLYRYTIGERCVSAACEILTCIQMANLHAGKERMVWFDEYIVYEERLRSLMGICCDTKKHAKNLGEPARESVGEKMYAEFMVFLQLVGKQMAGWRKYTEIESARVPEQA